ncbi:MAG: hypothetical protein J6O73_04280 [Lachnospiraceae bacterium]|nr:hypothetical protein [Lachnospiraceae bacterium]
MEAMTDYYKKQIIGYISDERYKQALLIDGDWGSGKTYFVDNTLIPELEKLEFVVFKLSLYGKTSISDIQSELYTQMIQYKLSKNEDSKAIKVLSTFRSNRLVSLLGTPLIKTLENKLGVNEGFGDGIKEWLASLSDTKIVLIFDDVERCKIDIIELMGFLNNLSENNGYKIILVAFEKEIEKRIDRTALAMQYGVALYAYMQGEHTPSTTKDIRTNSQNATGNNCSDSGRKGHLKEKIAEYKEMLFAEGNLYERTKEKLVGSTVKFNPNIDEVYDILAKNYVTSEERQKHVITHKDIVLSRFNRNSHTNLRTLINIFICIDRIFDVVDRVVVDFECVSDVKADISQFIDDERLIILEYVAYEYIRSVKGESLREWNGKRYGFGKSKYGSLFVDDAPFGYAFVDEYINNMYLNENTIREDISERIKNLIDVHKSKLESEEYKKLSVFKLKEWYYLKDEDVIRLIKVLEEELSENKYYPQDYKEIILLLMGINNPEFGMHPTKERIRTESGYLLEPAAVDFDEKAQEWTISHDEKVKDDGSSKTQDNVPYSGYEYIDIKKYVEIMTRQEASKDLTRQMLNIFTDDISFAESYRRLIEPLLAMVDEKEKSALKSSGLENEETFNNWDEKLYNFCNKNKNEYLMKGQFLSLYDEGTILRKLENADAEEITYLRDTLNNIYSFSNLNDAYSKDYSLIEEICKLIMRDRENNRKKYNSGNSRTKEIALRMLETDLQDILQRLSP